MPEKEISHRTKNNLQMISSSLNLQAEYSGNGKGIPENMGLKRLEPLGMQLVSNPVDQLEGKNRN